MTREALGRFFPGDVHHEEGFHRAVEAHLPYRGRLLDLGCGTNEEMARYRGGEREVWGADFHAHSQLRHADWFRLLGPSGEIPFPDNHFDIIGAVMVLEHVADPGRFLGEVRRVLRPGGVFVGHTVSAAHYVTWVRRAFGVLPHVLIQSLVRRLYGRPCEDTFPALYRMNSERALRRACGRAGLSLEALRRYACPCYFRFSRAARHLATMTDWALEQLRPGWGRLYFTVTLRKPAQGQIKAA
ncbi:MAG: class I SAM-dependent methyltransferase [Gemmataceae bacterium]